VRLNRWNLAVAGLAVSWGFVSVIVAGVDLSGEVLVFWRCVVAAGTLPLLLVALGRPAVLVLHRRRAQVLGLGLLLAVHWALFFETVKRASVAVAILTVYTAPIFLAVLAPLLLPERRSKIGLVALAVSAPGLALIALAGEGGSRVGPVAVGTGLGAAITYALLVMGTKTVVRDVSPFAVAFWTSATAALVIVPFAVRAGRFLPHPAEWPSVLALGALLTALSGVLYMRALRDVTAQAAGLLGYIEPASATFLAWAILGQDLGWQVALGGAAVLAGGALVVLSEPEDLAVPEAPPGVRMRA
jgi:drug/metabolite transporter (DMT)-like permease